MSLTFPELLKRESPGEHISDSQPSRLTDLITHWWTLKAKQTKAQIFSKVSELWWTCCCCIVQSHWTTQVLPCKQTWTTGDTLTVWVGVKRGAGGVLPVSMHKAANWAANEPDKIIRLVFIRSLLSGKPFIRSSEVLFFFLVEMKSPLQLIHTLQWLILKYRSLLWHFFDSCTIPTLVFLCWSASQFLSFETIILQLSHGWKKSHRKFCAAQWLKSSGLNLKTTRGLGPKPAWAAMLLKARQHLEPLVCMTCVYTVEKLSNMRWWVYMQNGGLTHNYQMTYSG